VWDSTEFFCQGDRGGSQAVADHRLLAAGPVSLQGFNLKGSAGHMRTLGEGASAAAEGVNLINGLVANGPMPGAVEVLSHGEDTGESGEVKPPPAKATVGTIKVSALARARMMYFVSERMWQLCKEIETKVSKTACRNICKQMAVQDCVPIEKFTVHHIPNVTRSILIATALAAAKNTSTVEATPALAAVKERMSTVGYQELKAVEKLAGEHVIKTLARSGWIANRHLANKVTVEEIRKAAEKLCPDNYESLVRREEQNTTMTKFLSNQKIVICIQAVTQAAKLVLAKVDMTTALPLLEKDAKQDGAPKAVWKVLGSPGASGGATKAQMEQAVGTGIIDGMHTAAKKVVATHKDLLSKSLKDTTKSLFEGARRKMVFSETLADVVAKNASKVEYDKNKNMIAYKADQMANKHVAKTITLKAAKQLGLTTGEMHEGVLESMEEAVGNHTKKLVRAIARKYLAEHGKNFMLKCAKKPVKDAVNRALRTGSDLAIDAAIKTASKIIRASCVTKTIEAAMNAAVVELIQPAMAEAFRRATTKVAQRASRLAVLSVERYIIENADEWSGKGARQAANRVVTRYLTSVGIDNRKAVSRAIDVFVNEQASGPRPAPTHLLRNATKAAAVKARKSALDAIADAIEAKAPIWDVAFDKAEAAADQAAVDVAAKYHEQQMAKDNKDPAHSAWFKKAITITCQIAASRAVDATLHVYRRDVLANSALVGDSVAKEAIESVVFKRRAMKDAVNKALQIAGTNEARRAFTRKCDIKQVSAAVRKVAFKVANHSVIEAKQNNFPIEATVYSPALHSLNGTVTSELAKCAQSARKAALPIVMMLVKLTRNKDELDTQKPFIKRVTRMLFTEYAYKTAGPLVRRVAKVVAEEESKQVGRDASAATSLQLSIRNVKTTRRMLEKGTEAAKMNILNATVNALKGSSKVIIADSAYKVGLPKALKAYKERVKYQPQPLAFSNSRDPVHAALEAAKKDKVFRKLKNSVAGQIAMVVTTSATDAAVNQSIKTAETVTAIMAVEPAVVKTEKTEGKKLADVCMKDVMKVAVDGANMVLAELEVMNWKTQAHTWARTKRLMRRHMMAGTLGLAFRKGRKAAIEGATKAANRAAKASTKDRKRMKPIEKECQKAAEKEAAKDYYSGGIKVCTKAPTGNQAAVAYTCAESAAGNETVRVSMTAAEQLVHAKVNDYAQASAEAAARKASSKTLKRNLFTHSDLIATSMASGIVGTVPSAAEAAALGAIKDTLVARALTRFHLSATKPVTIKVKRAMKQKRSIEKAADEEARRQAKLASGLELKADKAMADLAEVTAMRAAEMAALHAVHKDADLRAMANRIHSQTMQLALEDITNHVSKRVGKIGQEAAEKELKKTMSPAEVDVKDRPVRNLVLREGVAKSQPAVIQAAGKTVYEVVEEGKYISNYVYTQTCKAILQAAARPPALMYEVEKFASDEALIAAKKMGYPRGIDLATKAAKVAAVKECNANSKQWIMDAILKRAIIKGRGAAQSVTSKATVDMVKKVLSETETQAANDVMADLTLAGDEACMAVAKSKAKEVTLSTTMSPALAAAFNGRREGVKETIKTNGKKAIDDAWAKDPKTVEQAAWGVVAKDAVTAAVTGAEEGVKQVADNEGYSNARAAAIDGVVRHKTKDLTEKQIPGIVESDAVKSKIRESVVSDIQRIAISEAGRVVADVGVTADKEKISSAAEIASTQAIEGTKGVTDTALAKLLKVVTDDSIIAAQKQIVPSIKGQVKKGSPIDCKAKVEEGLSEPYATSGNLFFGKFSVPYKLNSADVQTPANMKVIKAAAFRAICDSMATDVTKQTLAENVIAICKAKGPDMLNAARAKVSKTLLNCGSFDGGQIRKMSEASVADVKVKLTEYSGDPKSLNMDTMLDGKAGERVFDKAREAAKLSSKVTKDATAAAKHAATRKKNIELLAHEVAKSVTKAISMNKVASMAAEEYRPKLATKLMKKAIADAAGRIKGVVQAEIQRAGVAAVESAGTKMGVNNPKAMEGAFKHMIANGWDLVLGTQIVMAVNKNIIKSVEKHANALVLEVATQACQAGQSMEANVMSNGLAKMDKMLLNHAKKQAVEMVAGKEVIVDGAAEEAVKKEVAKLSAAKKAGTSANVWHPWRGDDAAVG